MLHRTIKPYIEEFLGDKIVLLSGPRQVGKTYLSRLMNKDYQYFNFDSSEDRDIIQKKAWLRNGGLVIFDEIHKMKKWKSWIKGIYDKEKDKNKFLLTGSSRMDTFKKAGDSLAGRHFSVRLGPLSLNECGVADNFAAIDRMLKMGSFPEPFLANSERKATLWRRSHLDMIIRHDLVQLESLRDLMSIELLVDALRKRVGQQIVYSKLARELSVSPHTVKKWIQVLESFFIIFRIYPYTKKVLDSIKKEPKIYFYDVGQVDADQGFRLENLVALHLLKRNQFLEDTQGSRLRLGYIRDKRKREIDFAIEENGILTHLLEVKSSDSHYHTSLGYFSERLRPKMALQVVHKIDREKEFERFRVKDLGAFLRSLET